MAFDCDDKWLPKWYAAGFVAKYPGVIPAEYKEKKSGHSLVNSKSFGTGELFVLYCLQTFDDKVE